MSQNGEVRVRIAPSPTGDWHLGNARTALFSYLFAKKEGGKFYLRIEDTDQARFVEGSVERLLGILDWLDMKPDTLPDGKPYFIQSENLNRYREIAEQLVAEGKAYYCFATPEELEVMRQEQQERKEAPRYDNRWGYRDMPLEETKSRIEKGDPYVIRQKMPQTGAIAFNDLIHGNIEVDAAVIDDHVLLKSDGYPTYHLAHVVDDHDMAITHVIRGDEWLPSTPRHIALIESLGWALPAYAHVPVILGPDKGKLSKRHGAKPVSQYQEEGYLPEALLNFLVLLGWSSGTDQEIFTRQDMTEQFSLERVHPSPAVFNSERLDWFNGIYIRQLPLRELMQRILAYLNLQAPLWRSRYEKDPEFFSAVVAGLHDRIVTFGEFPTLADIFFNAPEQYDKKLLSAKSSSPEAAETALIIAEQTLLTSDNWSKEGLETELRRAAESHNLKAGALLWPIRVALTNQAASPGAFEMLAILGKDESLRRIRQALAAIKKV